MAARKKASTKKVTRKKATRKKTATKKSAAKKATRKKATRKKATRKKATRKRAPRKKTAVRTASPRARAKAALDRLQKELPPTLRDFSKNLRSNLSKLEKEIDKASSKYRRQAVRLLREGSHRLGSLEAQGEKGWRKLNTRARKEISSVVRRLQRAVEPATARRLAGLKKTAHKKAASKAQPEAAAAPQAPETSEEKAEEIPDVFQTPPSIGNV